MRSALNSALALLAAGSSLLGKAAEAKLVFAHYLVLIPVPTTPQPR